MATWYEILKRFSGPMRFMVKILDCVGLPAKFERILLLVLTIWVQFTQPQGESLKLTLNRVHWDPVSESAIPKRDREEHEERTA